MSDLQQPPEDRDPQRRSSWRLAAIVSNSYTLLLLVGLMVLLISLTVLLGVYLAHFGLEFPPASLGR